MRYLVLSLMFLVGCGPAINSNFESRDSIEKACHSLLTQLDATGSAPLLVQFERGVLVRKYPGNGILTFTLDKVGDCNMVAFNL